MYEAKDKREAEGHKVKLFLIERGSSASPSPKLSLHRRPQVRGGRNTPQSFFFCSISFASLRDPFTLSKYAI